MTKKSIYVCCNVVVLLINAVQVCGDDPNSPQLTHNPYLRPDWLPVIARSHKENRSKLGQGLVLRATLTSMPQSIVLINDRLLSVGDSYEDYRLLRVEEGMAVLIKNQQEVTLTITNEELP